MAALCLGRHDVDTRPLVGQSMDFERYSHRCGTDRPFGVAADEREHPVDRTANADRASALADRACLVTQGPPGFYGAATNQIRGNAACDPAHLGAYRLHRGSDATGSWRSASPATSTRMLIDAHIGRLL